jgi:hypothetical protein
MLVGGSHWTRLVLPLSCCRLQEDEHMVFNSPRATRDVRGAEHRLKRVATSLSLMSIGAVVCISLAACGGRDDDATQESSASSNAATPQSASQPDLPTVANAAGPASNGLAPPVMHYAQ